MPVYTAHELNFRFQPKVPAVSGIWEAARDEIVAGRLRDILRDGNSVINTEI